MLTKHFLLHSKHSKRDDDNSKTFDIFTKQEVKDLWHMRDISDLLKQMRPRKGWVRSYDLCLSWSLSLCLFWPQRGREESRPLLGLVTFGLIWLQRGREWWGSTTCLSELMRLRRGWKEAKIPLCLPEAKWGREEAEIAFFLSASLIGFKRSLSSSMKQNEAVPSPEMSLAVLRWIYTLS